MAPGAFVRVLFPPHEKPRRPGLLQIGYVLGCTSSEAMALNQSRPFVMRLDLLAKLPLTDAWFPDIARPQRGVTAVTPARLQQELTDLAMNLVRRRRALIQICGP